MIFNIELWLMVDYLVEEWFDPYKSNFLEAFYELGE